MADVITLEMIEAGVKQWQADNANTLEEEIAAIYTAMNTASTIPTDGDAEWLRSLGEKRAVVWPDDLPRLERIANRLASLSTIPSAGEIERFWPRPWSATRPGGEEMVQVLDAHGRTILRLEWPFHSEHDADAAEQATYALSDAIAALSIQTISGKGMREALEEAAEQLETCAKMLEHRHVEPLATRAVARKAHEVLAALVDQGERG